MIPVKQLKWDPVLCAVATALLLFGLLMVGSSSIAIAESTMGQPLYYFIRQCAFALVCLLLVLVFIRLPMSFWEKIAPSLLLGSFVVLILVLIPGLGHEVNGSQRWFRIFGIAIQVSEIVKLCLILAMSAYIHRHMEGIQNQVMPFLKPLIVIFLIAGLLLLQPDFGAASVMMATGLGMLFLAGAKWRHFGVMLILVCGVMALLAVSSPYRWERLTTFLNPWAYQFDSGYQLTQALIAFGRGEWFGVGLGDSVQKLFYLPEAHTDFVFAVIGEEMGIFGVLAVMVLYVVLLWRGLWIGRFACSQGQIFNGFVAYGVSIQIALQAVINMGVNTGLLPTKGLTLPFISYGGSSLIATAIGLLLLLRIYIEGFQPAKNKGF